MQKLIYSLFLLFIISLILPAQQIQAQVLNVERYKSSADTFNVWSGSISFGFNIADQGKRELNIRNDANLTYYSRRHQYLFLNRINLREVGDGSTSNGYFHIRSIFYRQNWINPEMFTQFQYNLDLGMQRRALLGANARFRIFETDKFYGAVSTGLMIENELWKEEVDIIPDNTMPIIGEDYDPNPGTREVRTENNFLKSTTSLNFRGNLHEDISIVLFGYYQARPDRFFQPRITADVQLQYQLRDNIRLGVQYVSTFDADPVLDQAEFVYSFNNILILSF